MDLSALKDVLRDERCWTCLAVVTTPEGETDYVEIVTEDGALVDVLVDVVTMPDGNDITCRLFASGGQWTIPNEGDEVIVTIPAGEIGFMPAIVARFDRPPSDLAKGRTVITNAEVFVTDEAGGANELVTMAEFRGHGHPGGTGPTGATIDPIPGVGPITGTTVLKAK